MSDEINSHTIIAIITGLLLSISEILPFISSIRSNGLLHFLVDQGNKFLKQKESEETRPLLPVYREVQDVQDVSQDVQDVSHDLDNVRGHEKDTEHGKAKQKKIKYESESESENESDEREDNLIRKRKRQKKQKNKSETINKVTISSLKTSEEYELDFLKNYITAHYLDHIIILPSFHMSNRTLFEKMGYKIFYDHVDDKYTLKW